MNYENVDLGALAMLALEGAAGGVTEEPAIAEQRAGLRQGLLRPGQPRCHES